DSDITLPDDRPLRATAPVDMLRCTDRTTIPALDNVTSVAWSADSSAVAMSRINVIPSHTTITGYEEQLQLTVYYVRSGRVQEIGQGSRPQWSGSGAYLSYWRDDGLLYIYLDGTIAGTIDATFTEWSPRGETLLVRSNDKLAVMAPSGTEESAPLSSFPGPVHEWTADGRLLVGAVSATVPGGNVFDRIPVWDPTDEQDRAIATLPNLFGTRSFSPDGRWFTGVSRTGLYETQLELYRCGVASGQGVDLRADPASRSRLARIEGASRRFVRPVAGAVSQFLQGSHTGIDLAAPFGSIIVAADDGVVDAAGWVQVGGRRVCVQHAEGIESCYYHTSAALVAIGDRVARGQPIALVGMTGATTGPHVHWEVKENGRIIDPLSH